MTSPTKFYHVIQIILQICSCDQSLVTLVFLWEKLSQPQFYKDLTRKAAFFEELFWFKFNSLELVLSTNLKFYISPAKVLKLKLRKFWGLIPTYVEVTGEKLVEAFLQPNFEIVTKSHITFNEEILNGKLHFLCSERSILGIVCLCSITSNST